MGTSFHPATRGAGEAAGARVTRGIAADLRRSEGKGVGGDNEQMCGVRCVGVGVDGWVLVWVTVQVWAGDN